MTSNFAERILIDSTQPDLGLSEMRDSIQALEGTVAKELEGESKLELVTTYNEIKKEFDELLTDYRTVFLDNVQTAEEAVQSFRDMDEFIGNKIKQSD